MAKEMTKEEYDKVIEDFHKKIQYKELHNEIRRQDDGRDIHYEFYEYINEYGSKVVKFYTHTVYRFI